MACLFEQASRHVSLAHLLKFRWTSRHGEVATHLARCMKTTQNAALLRERNFLLTVGAEGGLGYPIRAMQARICFSLKPWSVKHEQLNYGKYTFLRSLIIEPRGTASGKLGHPGA